MHNQHSVFWRKAPFIRIVTALIVGILIQWNTRFSLQVWLFVALTSLIILFSFSFTSFFSRFKLGFINGISISFLFVCLGGFLTNKQDIRNDSNWFGRQEKNVSGYVAVLDEPLHEKPNSFKAIANVKELIHDGKNIRSTGKIIIYFKKDSLPLPGLGSKIIFPKPVEEIKNAGNPGSFDYKRYGLLHGFTHQVFLEPGDYSLLAANKNKFRQFIYGCQQTLLEILRKNIRGEKELGLAEALLIGYKDDLDKSLVQSYSNTGVVHIIAISGLHLGLIYLLLSLLTKPLIRFKRLQGLRFILIITGLWLFTLMAGAQPSILRSAIMFSCIATGDLLYKKASIYNTLAVSAFILLCINPFWLWDLGFQLSYSALLSIVIFQRPIYNLFYIRNKLLDWVWKLNAVTLAAQVLTVPLTVYYFHQFPTFFLITNFLAVPLSSLILLGEILLCSISILPIFAEWIGRILSWLIRFMNTYIERIDAIQFSAWQGLKISGIQLILLYGFIILVTAWLNNQWRMGLKFALAGLLAFFTLRSISFIEANGQQKILVYNVPRKQAIDLISGRLYFYIGDSVLNADPYSRHFYLDPSRTRLRIQPTRSLNGIVQEEGWIYWNRILVVSAQAKISFSKLTEEHNIRKVVFDASVPGWKSKSWKKECDSLQIPWYDVNEKGAFVMNLNKLIN